MSSLTITTRGAKDGPRYVVRYRLGGRTYPIVHAGSFKTLKEAKARRDLVAGELAGGRNPADALRALRDAPKPRTFAGVFADFIASRIDVSAATLENYRTHRDRLIPLLEEHDPATLTWQDVQAVVAELGKSLSASSVKIYVGTLRALLDYADVDPNPARDKHVRLPRSEDKIIEPPSEKEVAAIIANAPKRWRLAIRLLEQTGLRVGELQALTWGDLDFAGSRLRVANGKTRAARRWATVPEWLMDEIAETVPPDDRVAERRVFTGATRQVLGMAMRKACASAGIANYSPHSLRHRYASVKIREGVPVTDLAAQLGHSRKSLTLDTYSHVLVHD
jgi:integrase